MNSLHAAAILMATTAFGVCSPIAQAAPGDWINSGPTPLTFVDNATKKTYTVGFNANETEPGIGNMGFFLNAPFLSVSSMHGANVAIRETWSYSQTNPPTPPQVVVATDNNGNPTPFNISLWEQGQAGHQAVSISREAMELSAHSFVHSDAPNIVYMGPVTVDVRLEKQSGQIKVVIYTPKGPIKLAGLLSGTPSSSPSNPPTNTKERDKDD